jgi:hypothetical protein
MKFRTIPPDPEEFPRLGLIWPPLVPALFAIVLWLAERDGRTWSVHGTGVLILGLFLGSTILAFVASIVSLSFAVPALRAHPSLRTKRNLACALFAALAVLFCGAYVGLGIYGIAVS